ncbi:hypothetical membrane protein [Corynebacterium renale]|uniref:DUF4190 domain-containing protein n=1 Tax=Corynebacterium renale TaxID=1724 RepID=UPI000DA39763|nr:DUF4190 domain-containing protein [Corynebacterium renale]SQG64826.1 hypothetical membrane protein [Corynebacterium renale]STC96379.1 hypothetical membrane protein [Corynebacterium renale]
MTNPFNNPNEEDNTNPFNGANEANHTNPFASADDRNDAASGHVNAQAENKETTSGAYPDFPQYPGSTPTSPQGAEGGAQPAYQPYGAIPDQAPVAAGGWELANQARNKLSPWALGVGIFSLVSSTLLLLIGIGPLLGVLFGLIAIVLSIVALVKAKNFQGPGQRKGMAIGGLITGILGLVIGAVIIFGAFALFSEVGEACGDLTGAEQEQCLADYFGVDAETLR